MFLRGSFMPLGAQLCPLGHFYAPYGSSVRPPLCVRALASFKPLEAHICLLGAHLCPLGLNYAPWDTFMPPGDQVCAPPQAYVAFLCVRALASSKPLEAHICPLGAHLCPLGHFYVPWGSSACPPSACMPPPPMCALHGFF
jgi:hypothetical protein